MVRKRACFRGRLNLLFLLARPRKLKRLTAADRESWSGTLPPRERSEWGALRQKIVFPTLFSKKRAGFGVEPQKSLVKLTRPQVLQALRRLCFAAAESFNNFVKLILFKLHTCRINNKPCAYRYNLSYDFKSVFLECGACFDNIYYTIGKP